MWVIPGIHYVSCKKQKWGLVADVHWYANIAFSQKHDITK
jgi:hypothetical protein